MGFWNFVGKMALFNFVWKQLFSSGKSSETRSCPIKVRGVVPEQESENDMIRGYNEEALDAVDDIESRLDDYELERYDYLADHDDPGHYDFDHHDFLDDHDW